jgi:hypothetical protein
MQLAGDTKFVQEVSQLGISLTGRITVNISNKISGRSIDKSGSRLRKMVVVEGSRLNFGIRYYCQFSRGNERNCGNEQ